MSAGASWDLSWGIRGDYSGNNSRFRCSKIVLNQEQRSEYACPWFIDVRWYFTLVGVLHEVCIEGTFDLRGRIWIHEGSWRRMTWWGWLWKKSTIASPVQNCCLLFLKVLEGTDGEPVKTLQHKCRLKRLHALEKIWLEEAALKEISDQTVIYLPWKTHQSVNRCISCMSTVASGHSKANSVPPSMETLTH